MSQLDLSAIALNEGSDESDEEQFNLKYEEVTTKHGGRAVLIATSRYHWRRLNANNTDYWRCHVRSCPATAVTINGYAQLGKRIYNVNYIIYLYIDGPRHRRRSQAVATLEPRPVASILSHANKIEQFCTYFVNTWFEGRFPVHLWNHSTTVGPRTNNHVEGFHNKLNTWAGRRKPDVMSVIGVFVLLDSASTDAYQKRLQGARVQARSNKLVEKDEKISNMVKLLDDNAISISRFLYSVSFLVDE